VAILLRIWILSVISEDTGDRFIQLQGMVQNLCVSLLVFSSLGAAVGFLIQEEKES
jgi:hypothetical protein